VERRPRMSQGAFRRTWRRQEMNACYIRFDSIHQLPRHSSLRRERHTRQRILVTFPNDEGIRMTANCSTDRTLAGSKYLGCTVQKHEVHSRDHGVCRNRPSSCLEKAIRISSDLSLGALGSPDAPPSFKGSIGYSIEKREAK
jgi:hypothetical protein